MRSTSILAAVLAIAGPVFGQAISSLPTCAQGPVGTAISASGCLVTDLRCVCGSPLFYTNAVQAIDAACSVADRATALMVIGAVICPSTAMTAVAFTIAFPSTATTRSSTATVVAFTIAGTTTATTQSSTATVVAFTTAGTSTATTQSSTTTTAFTKMSTSSTSSMTTFTATVISTQVTSVVTTGAVGAVSDVTTSSAAIVGFAVTSLAGTAITSLFGQTGIVSTVPSVLGEDSVLVSPTIIQGSVITVFVTVTVTAANLVVTELVTQTVLSTFSQTITLDAVTVTSNGGTVSIINTITQPAATQGQFITVAGSVTTCPLVSTVTSVSISVPTSCPSVITQFQVSTYFPSTCSSVAIAIVTPASCSGLLKTLTLSTFTTTSTATSFPTGIDGFSKYVESLPNGTINGVSSKVASELLENLPQGDVYGYCHCKPLTSGAKVGIAIGSVIGGGMLAATGLVAGSQLLHHRPHLKTRRSKSKDLHIICGTRHGVNDLCPTIVGPAVAGGVVAGAGTQPDPPPGEIPMAMGTGSEDPMILHDTV